MLLFYTSLIQFYGLFMHFASFFNVKAKKWSAGRKDWQPKLIQQIDKKVAYCWIHCASAGEFEQAIPLIKEVRIKNKGQRIAVSFFSSSGFELHKGSNLADIFFYFPLDTKKNARQLIEILNPAFVVFIRSEIWWNTLSALKKKNIPTFLINANLKQKRTFLYQRYLQKSYSLFTKIFDTSTFGNTKLERVIENKKQIFKDETLDNFCKDSIVIILGSSWSTEEQFIFRFYTKHKDIFPNVKIIIAPHEYDENKEAELVNLFQEKILSYSNSSTLNAQCSILLLDKKGILKYAYRYANIVLIGGGFGAGVHNIAEAAVYGIVTIFGSNYQKFEEAKELTNIQAAFSINTYEMLENKLIELMTNNKYQNIIKEKLEGYFSKQETVSQKIVDEINILV